MTLSPTPLLRGALAPAPRTLVDIVWATARAHPDATALDSGADTVTYAEFIEAAEALAAELAELGIGRGDRVGVRAPSGTTDLYVAIMGILFAGAAYVPVDAEDPDDRARLVFGEAGVAAVIGDGLAITPVGEPREPLAAVVPPGVDDDAWIIFTSGSTGTPKGVAVSHRNAAAFVDAESRMFLQEEPIGPADRVMAGLSVAFDASCEEMWLAWRYGATLVPAPRALVRSGVDVGGWLAANEITVVSTVPTLISLWPDDSISRVRLLILGGEALPPELAARLVRDGREVWNTYGPTEATVVACGAQVTAEGPVRIGLPLDGWDLAVADADGRPVAEGERGELIIGGVGLARYLDPAKDAEKYAPMPTLGWDRAYRSGDIVVNDPAGLLFAGRADDQIKLGGRRIELGEIDSALLALPGVAAAAAAVRRSATGNQLLVGYVALDVAVDAFDAHAATAHLRATMPAALVPRLAVVEEIPTRTSGKVDRDALPWPLVGGGTAGKREVAGFTPTMARIAEVWEQVIGAGPDGPETDFFDLGGGSLTAAQVVTMLRAEHPEVTVGDVYAHPTPRELAAFLDALDSQVLTQQKRRVAPIPRKSQVAQALAVPALRLLAVPRWLAWTALGSRLAHDLYGVDAVPAPSWPWVLIGLALFVSPPGRILIAAGAIRATLAGIRPGDYPRGGKVHLRLWAAERIGDQLGAVSLAGAPWLPWYALLLGARIGFNADLHTLPPVTGNLRVGKGASIEPEVDLSGYWIDGNTLHLGSVVVGKRARIGTRTMLGPGAVIGDDAEIAPGSAVFGTVPEGEFWSGAPASRMSRSARGPWDERPRASRGWSAAYGALALLLGSLPLLAAAITVAVLLPIADPTGSERPIDLLWLVVPGTLLGWPVLAGLVLLVVRALGAGLEPGAHPVRSPQALRVWGTIRVLDEARTWLFPLYSSQLTPLWLRLLGARIGKDVEASTVLMIPSLCHVNDQAFLADDTLIGGYELGGGWLRAERVKVGKRAFVGNSAMAAPGRKVPKRSLVAVLSAAPRRKAMQAGESWLGSPPAPLRRAEQASSDERTYAPPTRLKVARAAWEVARLLPVLLTVTLTALVAVATLAAWDAGGVLAAVLALAGGLLAAGALAALVAVAAKWLLIGRVGRGSHPLWSSFVWRNELADTFVEVLAVPWFAGLATGSPLLNAWFRAMGARVGRGVWCETYWLPEADLVTLGDGATVNQGSVVQTHLFHDRLLATDGVTLLAGATLGSNSVVLPAAGIGRHATVGPVSLVMRGETVPHKTRWIGNPIGPWVDEQVDEQVDH
ncbi:amino acid adenylation domain-containing protein [Nocardioides sp. GY 10113]|uniref:Pls/PosA family non-ribosomal peptide synthetase n=1 Tax=Nocardioides sp. GY 10113 TaxID=2569761 RepID=UPI0010A89990|nr:Pls/PosA family non-ribosomal peptide synthetase [Nocardioides sp. GY 10113]TIC79661.1 amino acid adenylation domain-containing protein [Nocardioides sp. GY 10113]TIC85786.1 amino acid adenylation domain-containing protein [Nocardioides sp. GY 10113]